MAEKQSDETTIREYLLGNIDPESELAERLDERLLTDRDFSALTDRIEEEIIQDYLEGELEPSERAAMERYFLRPPERQKKLRRARLLNRHLAARGDEQEQLKRAPAPPRPSRVALWTSYAGWAAALLLMISAGYLVNSQRALRSEVAQKTEDLERAHEQAAIAKASLESAFAALPQPAAQLNFYGREPGLVRGTHLRSLPQVATGTKTLNVQLLLDNITIKPGCQVLLQSKAGKMAWFSQVPVSHYDNYSGVLVFNVPVDGIAPGEYQFKVSQCTSSEQTFPFQISNR
jgi:hypothetical protein